MHQLPGSIHGGQTQCERQRRAGGLGSASSQGRQAPVEVEEKMPGDKPGEQTSPGLKAWGLILRLFVIQ